MIISLIFYLLYIMHDTAARYSFEVDPDAEKKLFATFNVLPRLKHASVFLFHTIVSGPFAPEAGTVQGKECKRLCSLVALLTLFLLYLFDPPSLLQTCAIFVLMNLSQDDLCIQLSKNIEPEERKTFPAPAALATSDAAAQAAAALSRTAAAPSSAVLPPPPVETKTPRVAVVFPSPTLSSSAVPPPSSAVPASLQPPTAAASPAASANP